MTIDANTIDTAMRVSTATVTTVLLKKGLRNVWMRGAAPLQPASRASPGRAFTLRFVPAREDLATPASWASPISTRAAIEDDAGGLRSPSPMPWASPMPASSATSCAPAW